MITNSVASVFKSHNYILCLQLHLICLSGFFAEAQCLTSISIYLYILINVTTPTGSATIIIKQMLRQLSWHPGWLTIPPSTELTAKARVPRPAPGPSWRQADKWGIREGTNQCHLLCIGGMKAFLKERQIYWEPSRQCWELVKWPGLDKTSIHGSQNMSG